MEITDELITKLSSLSKLQFEGEERIELLFDRESSGAFEL